MQHATHAKRPCPAQHHPRPSRATRRTTSRTMSSRSTSRTPRHAPLHAVGGRHAPRRATALRARPATRSRRRPAPTRACSPAPRATHRRQPPRIRPQSAATMCPLSQDRRAGPSFIACTIWHDTALRCICAKRRSSSRTACSTSTSVSSLARRWMYKRHLPNSNGRAAYAAPPSQEKTPCFATNASGTTDSYLSAKWRYFYATRRAPWTRCSPRPATRPTGRRHGRSFGRSTQACGAGFAM